MARSISMFKLQLLAEILLDPHAAIRPTFLIIDSLSLSLSLSVVLCHMAGFHLH